MKRKRRDKREEERKKILNRGTPLIRAPSNHFLSTSMFDDAYGARVCSKHRKGYSGRETRPGLAPSVAVYPMQMPRRKKLAKSGKSRSLEQRLIPTSDRGYPMKGIASRPIRARVCCIVARADDGGEVQRLH